MEPYEDTMGMDADELLLEDIRETVTQPPPVVPGLMTVRIGADEQHTVKAGGS